MEEQQIQEITQNVYNIKEIIEGQIPSLALFALRVLVSLIIFFVGMRVTRWLLGHLRKTMERAGVDRGVIQFLCSFLKFFIYALLVFNICTSIGVKETSVAALLGTAGVTVGLALQGGLANIAGGVILLLFKPFTVGDFIVQDPANGIEGTVDKIEICYTTLRLLDNRKITIPNGTLANSTIINASSTNHRKIEVRVRITYDSDLEKAKNIFFGLLRENPCIKEEEEMLVFVDDLDASGIMLMCRAGVAADRYLETKWQLNDGIIREFRKNGIRIAHDQLDVCLKEQESQG